VVALQPGDLRTHLRHAQHLARGGGGVGQLQSGQRRLLRRQNPECAVRPRLTHSGFLLSVTFFFSLGQTKGVCLWAQCARVKQVSAYTSMMHFPSSCGIHAARFCLSVTAFSTTAQQRHPAR